MNIKNVTRDDDSQNGPLGRYECHAFAVNDTEEKKHGFTVNVISSKYYYYCNFSLILKKCCFVDSAQNL